MKLALESISMEELVMAALWPAKKPMTVGDISRRIASLTDTLLATKRKQGIERALASDSRHFESIVVKNKATRYRLTATGAEKIRQRLGQWYPKKLEWPHLKEKYLPATAVGLCIDSAAVSRNAKQHIKAMLLLQRTDLADMYAKLYPGPPKLPLVMNFIIAQTVKSKNATNENAIMARLVSQALNHWQAAPEPIQQDISAPAPMQSSTIPQSLDEFVEMVKRMAPLTPTGWFGDDKVFIGHLWKFGHNAGHWPYSLTAFKMKLLEAHRQGLLKLAPEDLPHRRDPNDIRASAIQHSNDEYHYLRTEKGRP